MTENAGSSAAFGNHMHLTAAENQAVKSMRQRSFQKPLKEVKHVSVAHKVINLKNLYSPIG